MELHVYHSYTFVLEDDEMSRLHNFNSIVMVYTCICTVVAYYGSQPLSADFNNGFHQGVC